MEDTRKIIIVDNHPVILKFMTDLLEKQGYRVKTATNSLSALGIIDTWIPDAMFIDMVMPNISGDKLCKIIRSMPKLNKVYIIILSAIAAEAKIDFLQIGADACIAKGPFDKMSKHVLDVLNLMDSENKKCVSGEIKGIEDVYEREIAKELLSAKKHFEVILNNMSEGIFEITQEGRIVYANPSAISLSGMTEETLLTSDFYQLFQEDQREEMKNLASAAESATQIEVDESLFDLNGKQVSVNLISVDDSANRSFVAVINDITLRKQMENKLRDARRAQAIATMAGGIAHNFNNALSVITGNIELLKISIPEVEQIEKYTDEMDKSAYSMANLTSQLLSYAEGGKNEIKIISANEIVENTLSLIQHTMDPGIHVEKNIAENVSRVKADFTQIQMIISAIIANAQEALDGNGFIRISVRNEIIDVGSMGRLNETPGNYVCFSVEDNGKGMNTETKNKMFDPFFTTKLQGRGLSMAAVHGIVKNHDGSISVNSKPDVGTQVDVLLPAVDTNIAGGATKSMKTVNGTRTVLVIEDEEMVLDVSRKMLEKLNCHVLQARNGSEAGNIVENYTGDIDLAIMDICLPDMMGGALYPIITKACPKMKVLISSGYSLEGPARKILDAGAEGFIQKPYSFSALSKKLEEVLCTS
ncbi:MAG: response regulator [Deltaproteobacteria bacterium]|nr:response regulator [Deltaproteobacteria bacterium]